MATYLGRNSAIGFGEESTWGTAVSRTAWRPLNSASLLRTATFVPRPDLKSDSGSAMRRGHYQSAEEMTGSFEIAATYDNIGMILKHALGTVASSGSGPYTYTYTLAAAPPTGLTIETVRGTSGKSEVFEGCKINTLTMSVSAGECMMVSCDVIGQTGAARGTAGTPSYSGNENLIHHNHAGQLSFNSVNYDLSSFSLTVNNSLARRQLLGSVETSEPLRTDFMSVEFSFDIEAVDTLYTALLAGTQGDATITFTGPSSRSMAFTIHNFYLTSASDAVSGAGIVTASCAGSAESDGTDEGLQIVVVNQNNDPVGN
jgi:hypothetical protein